jgi:hypothetical protein
MATGGTGTTKIAAAVGNEEAQAKDAAHNKNGPRDVIDVSWAVGKFLCYSFHFLVLTKFPGINYGQ